MLQEKLLRRLLARRLARAPRQRQTRTFAHNVTYTSNTRPQLPFLTIPTNKPHARYLSTETKQWLKNEARMAVRYTVGIWGVFACGIVLMWAVNQEMMEREFPTPYEWTFITRVAFRNAAHVPHRTDGEPVNWGEVMAAALSALDRLEDPKLDGKGVAELVEGSIYVEGVGKLGYDVSEKSENWRRGYYETMMLVARAAEHLDGWVRDTSRNYIFPGDMVVGPSNPHPKPIPAGVEGAPKEEDCERAYEPAENFYLRVLTTKGFTARQKMDAALAYASFMDFKKLPDAAESMYKWALSLATEELPESAVPRYDRETLTLNEQAGKPPANLLTTLTAFATHKASSGDVASALPMFISILKARRNLSDPPASYKLSTPAPTLLDTIFSVMKPLKYPPPPPDGSEPPIRTPHELCVEAGLSMYIGEILFATKDREAGVMWTREAVDAAEDQLREVHDRRGQDAARKTCRECLTTGLTNWGTMAAALAKAEAEEKEKKKGKGGSRFGLWSRAKEEVEVEGGRWAKEGEVVEERMRRTRGMVEEARPEESLLMALFKV